MDNLTQFVLEHWWIAALTVGVVVFAAVFALARFKQGNEPQFELPVIDDVDEESPPAPLYTPGVGWQKPTLPAPVTVTPVDDPSIGDATVPVVASATPDDGDDEEALVAPLDLSAAAAEAFAHFAARPLPVVAAKNAEPDEDDDAAELSCDAGDLDEPVAAPEDASLGDAQNDALPAGEPGTVVVVEDLADTLALLGGQVLPLAGDGQEGFFDPFAFPGAQGAALVGDAASGPAEEEAQELTEGDKDNDTDAVAVHHAPATVVARDPQDWHMLANTDPLEGGPTGAVLGHPGAGKTLPAPVALDEETLAVVTQGLLGSPFFDPFPSDGTHAPQDDTTADGDMQPLDEPTTSTPGFEEVTPETVEQIVNDDTGNALSQQAQDIAVSDEAPSAGTAFDLPDHSGPHWGAFETDDEDDIPRWIPTLAALTEDRAVIPDVDADPTVLDVPTDELPTDSHEQLWNEPAAVGLPAADRTEPTPTPVAEARRGWWAARKARRTQRTPEPFSPQVEPTDLPTPQWDPILPSEQTTDAAQAPQWSAPVEVPATGDAEPLHASDEVEVLPAPTDDAPATDHTDTFGEPPAAPPWPERAEPEQLQAGTLVADLPTDSHDPDAVDATEPVLAVPQWSAWPDTAPFPTPVGDEDPDEDSPATGAAPGLAQASQVQEQLDVSALPWLQEQMPDVVEWVSAPTFPTPAEPVSAEQTPSPVVVGSQLTRRQRRDLERAAGLSTVVVEDSPEPTGATAREPRRGRHSAATNSSNDTAEDDHDGTPRPDLDPQGLPESDVADPAPAAPAQAGRARRGSWWSWRRPRAQQFTPAEPADPGAALLVPTMPEAAAGNVSTTPIDHIDESEEPVEYPQWLTPDPAPAWEVTSDPTLGVLEAATPTFDPQPGPAPEWVNDEVAQGAPASVEPAQASDLSQVNSTLERLAHEDAKATSRRQEQAQRRAAAEAAKEEKARLKRVEEAQRDRDRQARAAEDAREAALKRAAKQAADEAKVRAKAERDAARQRRKQEKVAARAEAKRRTSGDESEGTAALRAAAAAMLAEAGEEATPVPVAVPAPVIELGLPAAPAVSHEQREEGAAFVIGASHHHSADLDYATYDLPEPLPRPRHD